MATQQIRHYSALAWDLLRYLKLWNCFRSYNKLNLLSPTKHKNLSSIFHCNKEIKIFARFLEIPLLVLNKRAYILQLIILKYVFLSSILTAWSDIGFSRFQSNLHDLKNINLFWMDCFPRKFREVSKKRPTPGCLGSSKYVFCRMLNNSGGFLSLKIFIIFEAVINDVHSCGDARLHRSVSWSRLSLSS